MRTLKIVLDKGLKIFRPTEETEIVVQYTWLTKYAKWVPNEPQNGLSRVQCDPASKNKSSTFAIL